MGNELFVIGAMLQCIGLVFGHVDPALNGLCLCFIGTAMLIFWSK